uniref:CM3 protein n=1 Tax=Pectinaria gouldii TaxID=260746 RepID=V5L1P4_PECGU|nr:CM3 protein [Pectinaria gouldii]
MKSLIVLCALFGMSLATVTRGHGEKYCYQCAYSPPRTYTDKEVVIEKKRYDGDDGYGYYEEKTYVPVQKQANGGWDKCKDDFTAEDADNYGIDVWDCHSNCYVRTEADGDIFRGCYKDEFGVDPNRLGCHYQAGAEWCFCKGSNCNNAKPTSYGA